MCAWELCRVAAFSTPDSLRRIFFGALPIDDLSRMKKSHFRFIDSGNTVLGLEEGAIIPEHDGSQSFAFNSPGHLCGLFSHGCNVAQLYWGVAIIK